MATKIFVNLPVKDLQKSIDFFTALGYSFNPQFTDENATCMIIEEGSIYAMLLTHTHFKTFIDKDIADATSVTQVINALEMPSKEAVDEIVQKALEAGGTRYRDLTDMGWMYQDSFADLDGHKWEVFWMDPNGFPQE
ncbi:VOC family protein [Emticicia soli]|uniref:VOC family protein n=1 Tax=Emticicia soli TaxID=2027878 RepID=A0ABW5JCH6_9BACT